MRIKNKTGARRRKKNRFLPLFFCVAYQYLIQWINLKLREQRAEEFHACMKSWRLLRITSKICEAYFISLYKRFK